jgi:hypothetical protein
MLNTGESAIDRFPRALSRAWRPPPAIELWRLRGACDELRGLAIETSFGYAFGLELDTELVAFHLNRSLESMVAYADRKHGPKTLIVLAYELGRNVETLHRYVLRYPNVFTRVSTFRDGVDRIALVDRRSA